MFGVFFFTVTLIQNAWLCDDAHITFRTVDNFLHGYGLRWNVFERVQSYTHPLWLLLLIFSCFFTREFHFTPLLLSLGLSWLTMYILVFKLTADLTHRILVLIILICSKSFIDYSTSGLENPLTHFLLANLLWVYLKKESNSSQIYQLTLLAGLTTLNRLDTLLITAPILAHGLWRTGQWRNIYAVMGGFIPWFLWEGFSLFYYGFAVPNTAFAKLNTGIPQAQLLEQGLWYLVVSVTTDPVIILLFVNLWFAGRQQIKTNRAIALGIIIYLGYIIWIGGDFMSGRFFSPLIVGLIVLQLKLIAQSRHLVWVVVGVTIVLGLASPRGPFFNHKTKILGIADEQRLFYLSYDANLTPNEQYPFLSPQSTPHTQAIYVAGIPGLYLGPKAYLVDKLALTDPLLARLPAMYNPYWRIGHFERTLPTGYLATVDSGKNQLQDRNLAKYYDKLALITQGDLFDWQRLQEIWRMNTGQYDYLIDKMAYRYPEMKSITWDTLQTRTSSTHLGQHGLYIKLPEITHATTIELDFTRGYYQVTYFHDQTQVGQQIIWVADIVMGGVKITNMELSQPLRLISALDMAFIPSSQRSLVTYSTHVPTSTVTKGYNQIHFISLGLEVKDYQLQAIRLQ